MTKTKSNIGNFFEDFSLGQVIRHAAPRTVTSGEVGLYTALYLPRFAVQSSKAFAQAIGYADAPIDDILVFHFVLGKTVPDVSLNAIANLGYADFKFMAPVYPGDTLTATSEVIGLKENSNKETGVVYVRSTGKNQRGEVVLDYARWVMVKKRDKNAPVGPEVVPALPKSVAPADLGNAVPRIDVAAYDKVLAGSPYFWGDYEKGEKIDHIDGMTVEEAEHQLATRLYQNNSKVHFNQYYEAQARFGKRIIYDLAGARAIFQRAGECLPHRRRERWAARKSALRRRHGVRLERSARQGGDSRQKRHRRAAPAPSRDQGQALRGVSAERRRRQAGHGGAA